VIARLSRTFLAKVSLSQDWERKGFTDSHSYMFLDLTIVYGSIAVSAFEYAGVITFQQQRQIMGSARET
jgi:hypothetical protein